MTFLGFANSVALWGLLSLPIILALHLLRQRTRRYLASSLTLWSFLEEEVRGSRLRRIPLSLLLLLDLLIAALLSLAWAQPEVQVTTPLRQAQHTVILLDVSASMLAQDVLPTRFERARLEALALLGSLGPQDTATVVTFGTEPRWIGDTREIGVESLLAQVSALQAGEAETNAFPSALALALATPDPDLPLVVHALSDAAFSTVPLDEIEVSLTWHLYGSTANNQAVMDLVATPTEENEWEVFARIGNFGDASTQRILTLLADEQPVDSTPIRLGGGETVAKIWTVRGHPRAVTVQLAGGDVLPADDVASVGLRAAREVRVALVATDPNPLQRALETVPGVALTLLSPAEYLPGLPYDLFFFHEILPPEWPVGVTVVTSPPAGSSLLLVDSLVAITELPVPTADPVLDGVDLGGVRWEQTWSLTATPPLEPLIQAGNLPLLARYDGGHGVVYLLLADLNSGNLTRHPAFPVLIANLVKAAGAPPLPGQIGTGQPLPLPNASLYPTIDLSGAQGETVTFAAERPAAWTTTLEPGLYRLQLTKYDGAVAAVAVGVNAGGSRESAIRRGDWTQDSGIVQAQPASSAQRRVINLMPWLLLIALLLLLVEAWPAWR